MRRGVLMAVLFLSFASSAEARRISERRVHFSVVNQNRTGVGLSSPFLTGACTPDGKTYTIRGTLVAPRAALRRAHPSVALYLHGTALDSRFWRFPRKGYDYARAQARRGHASVVVDRLGYGRSTDADGSAICVGSQADIAAQIVAQLRDGTGVPVHFAHVALVGKDIGGEVAQVAQYALGAADALVEVGWADQGFSTPAVADFGAAAASCVTTPGTAYLGASSDEFHSLHFHDADPAVIAQATAARLQDPCGELRSAFLTLGADEITFDRITQPVFVIAGRQDGFFSTSSLVPSVPPQEGDPFQVQAASFTSSYDVTFRELPDTGAAVTLERSHRAFLRAMDHWLRAHGY